MCISNIIIIFVNRTRQTKRQPQKDTAMEVVDDVCESEGVCEVMCDVPSDQPEQGESMETHVSEEELDRMAKSVSAEEPVDLSAAAHSTENTSTEPLKPRYTYRLVLNKLNNVARYYKRQSQPCLGCFNVKLKQLCSLVWVKQTVGFF